MLPEPMHNSFFEELGELKLLDTACKNIGFFHLKSGPGHHHPQRHIT
ncbi:Uncharacterised protein [Vibrio cholerae]|nr:Uncharacterised protein [Vibrio cholerae]